MGGINSTGNVGGNTPINKNRTIDMATITRQKTTGPLLTFADNGDNKIGVGDVAYKTLPNGTKQALPVVGMEDLAYDGNAPVGIKLGKYGKDGKTIEADSLGKPLVSEIDITSRDRLKQAGAILEFESNVTTGELPKKDKFGNAIYDKTGKQVFEQREALPGEIAAEAARGTAGKAEAEKAAKAVDKDTALIDKMAGGGVSDSYPIISNFFTAKKNAREQGGTFNNPKYDAAAAKLNQNVVNVDNPQSDGVFNTNLTSGLNVKAARENIETKARQHLASPTIDKEIPAKLLKDYTENDMRY